MKKWYNAHTMRTLTTITLILIVTIFTACAAPPTPPSQAPPTPIQVSGFNGFSVSLLDYHWDDDELITHWQFFNDRNTRNRGISLFAYDQDNNRITSEWPIMSGPILMPGEKEEKTIPWKCGPRSTEITITVREAAKWNHEKTIPTADAHFTITR